MRFIQMNPVIVLAMPKNRALSDLPQKLKNLNVISYAHTTNNSDLAIKLNEYGMFGMYTGYLHISIY